MMQSENLSYTTRIWLFSVFVSPILLGFAMLLEGEIDLSFFGESVLVYGLMVFFGALFSLPAYGVFIFFNEVIFQNIDDIFIGKITSSLIGLFICYIIGIIFDGDLNLLDMEGSELYLFLSYPFTIFFGTWYFEPNPKT